MSKQKFATILIKEELLMDQTAKLNRDEYENLMKSACFVCRIVKGNPLTPGVHVVYEDDNYIAFLNQFPTQEGYTIVSPKRHIERFEEDMTAEECGLNYKSKSIK